jgi:anti-sigma regulatory factor (Ser/Thr protein kinase)
MTVSATSGGACAARPPVVTGPSGLHSGGVPVPCRGAWTRTSFLGLPALAASVPEFRRHARHILKAWGAGPVTDAELVISELATNAVRASRDIRPPAESRVWLGLAGRPGYLLIRVRDSAERMPVLRDIDLNSLSGRGLPLVAVLCEQWGWYPSGPGKTVWAILRTGDPAGTGGGAAGGGA